MQGRSTEYEAAQLLEAVVGSSADCIMVIDQDGTLAFINQAGLQAMDAADAPGAIGREWGQIWGEQARPAAQAALAAARSGTAGRFQGVATTQAGAPKYWDVHLTPVTGAPGRATKFLAVGRDITSARLAEQALRHAEGLNTPILGSSRDCIVVLDLLGHTCFVSPGGIEAMEVSDVQAILGLSWLRVWRGDDRVAAEEAVAQARRGGVGRFQGFCATHKGTPKWWDVAISPLLGPDGTPDRLVSVGRDITAQKALERQLRDINASLEQRVAERTADRNRLWQLSADIMVVSRPDGEIVAVNPAWTTILGWAEEELTGRRLLDLVHGEDVAATTGAMAPLSDGATAAAFTNRYRHKDGSYRCISWSAVPGGGLINAVGRDVTAERETADALHLAEEALRQSQKMEAVGQLTGGLAHDFNNLLTGVMGSLELMQTRIAQGRLAEVGRYVETAYGAAQRAAALTHRLLAFSRRQTLDPRPTDTNRLVIGMEELVRRTVGPEITVEVVAAEGLWSTLIDPGQLENALLNLCINARDAMPEGGKLTIETGNKWLDARAAQTRELPPGAYVTLCVSDNGTGMTPEVIARAFDPFYTTKPLGRGTGLGLSMIYGFVRQSGGQARIYSELGQGTMVCLYLPRHGGAPEQEAVRAAGAGSFYAAAPRAAEGQSVLVVDDEPTVRMLVREVLEDLGYTAREAGDGAAGLSLLRSGARVDLLVTDLGLPGGMNGRQFAEAARVLRPALKVLFITGYAENAVLSHGHLDEGTHVLTKPFALETLAAKIKALIAP